MGRLLQADKVTSCSVLTSLQIQVLAAVRIVKRRCHHTAGKPPPKHPSAHKALPSKRAPAQAPGGVVRRGRGGGSCGRAVPLLLCVAISLSHVRSDATIPAPLSPDSATPRTDFPSPPMGRQASGEDGRGGWGRGAVLRLRGAGDQATWIGDMAMVGGAGAGVPLETLLIFFGGLVWEALGSE